MELRIYYRLLKALKVVFLFSLFFLLAEEKLRAQEYLYTITGEDEETLSSDFIQLGDISGDGVTDFVIGGASLYQNSLGQRYGRTIVVSGRDGSPLHTFTGTEELTYGRGLFRIGDVTGDGIQDFAMRDDGIFNLRGRQFLGITLFSGASFEIVGKMDFFDLFGLYQINFMATETVGDVNADGKQDFAISYYGNITEEQFPPTSKSELLVFSGGDLQIITRRGLSEEDGYFSNLSAVRDVNNDGVQDLVVRKQIEDLYVFSGKDLSVLQHYEGGAIAALDDLNGDGLQELMITSSTDAAGPPALKNAGTVQILSGADGSLIKEHQGRGKNFGIGFQGTVNNGCFTSTGDFDGDGVSDYLFCSGEAIADPNDRGFPGSATIFSGADHQPLHTFLADDPADPEDFAVIPNLPLDDVNGDGLSDLLDLRISEVNPRDRSGSVSVVSGDLCPQDPQKSVPAFCGCGSVDEVDSSTGFVTCNGQLPGLSPHTPMPEPRLALKRKSINADKDRKGKRKKKKKKNNGKNRARKSRNRVLVINMQPFGSASLPIQLDHIRGPVKTSYQVELLLEQSNGAKKTVRKKSKSNKLTFGGVHGSKRVSVRCRVLFYQGGKLVNSTYWSSESEIEV